MAQQNLTAFDAALKERYEGRVQQILNRRTRLMRHISPAQGVMWQGRRVIKAVNTGRNRGLGAIGEGEDLPTAGRQEYANQVIDAKYNYIRIELTGQVMAAARTDANAFVAAVRSEIDGAVKDKAKDLNRQFYGDGTGVLATISGAFGGGATALDVLFAGNGVAELNEPGRKHIYTNDTVTIGTAAALGAGTATEFHSVVSGGDSDTFNIAAPGLGAGIAGGEHVVHARSASLTSYLKEIEGLDAGTDDGVSVPIYQGIDRTVVSDWAGNVFRAAGVGQTLTADLIQRAVDAANEAGGGEIDMAFMHYSVRRAYYDLLVPDKRYPGNANPAEMDLGFREDMGESGGEALRYNGVMFWFDADCPFSKLYLLDSDTWRVYKQTDFEWADEDNSILKNISNKDAWEAFMRCFMNLSCSNPAANSRIEDITATI